MIIVVKKKFTEGYNRGITITEVMHYNEIMITYHRGNIFLPTHKGIDVVLIFHPILNLTTEITFLQLLTKLKTSR